MSKKIRILFTDMSAKLAGIENFLINVYRNIDKDKFEVKFLVEKDIDVCFKNEIENDLIYYTGRKKNYLKCIKDLKSIFKENQFDYIHIAVMNYSFFERILLAQKYSNAKIILHSHTANNVKLSLITKVLNFVGKRLVKEKEYILLACSKAAGEYSFKSFKNKDFKVIENGIDIDKFIFNENIRNKFRKNLNLKNEDFVIGHVGRFETQKNHEFIIDIFNEIYKKNNHSKLILVGTGSLMEKIRKKVIDLKIDKNVIFLGRREDVNDLLQTFDVFLLPSLFEGLPIVAVESQASGLNTVLSTEITKETEIIPITKFISLDETAEFWANEILSLNKEYNRLKYKEEIEKSDYNIKQSVKKLERIYLENL